MTRLGIISGSGLEKINHLEISRQQNIDTPFGAPSSPVVFGKIGDGEVIFIPRHGADHSIAPHNINYRANIWALKELGVKNIVAANAVGGITEKMSPVKLVFPHQLIDYTHSRDHTFFDGNNGAVEHVDFTHPYDNAIRQKLINAAELLNIEHEPSAVYGTTQGPRLETSAEIERMQRDGCDIVGMTGMPEAGLARELELNYASCSVVVNWAAGKTGGIITMHEIESNMSIGMDAVHKLFSQALPELIKL